MYFAVFMLLTVDLTFGLRRQKWLVASTSLALPLVLARPGIEIHLICGDSWGIDWLSPRYMTKRFVTLFDSTSWHAWRACWLYLSAAAAPRLGSALLGCMFLFATLFLLNGIWCCARVGLSKSLIVLRCQAWPRRFIDQPCASKPCRAATTTMRKTYYICQKAY